MQYRSPVGSGPSSKRWPRWASHLAQRTSVRTIPCSRSSTSFTLLRSTAAQKLGQPVPESNFVSDLNSPSPQTTHLYMPTPLWSQYLPLNGRSVAEHCVTWYSIGDRRALSCASSGRFGWPALSMPGQVPSVSCALGSMQPSATPTPRMPGLAPKAKGLGIDGFMLAWDAPRREYPGAPR